MEIKDILKTIEDDIASEDKTFGDSFGLVYQSYSTYAIAVKLTEEFYKITNLMASDEVTEENLANQLEEIIKICIKSIKLLDVASEEDEEEEEEERTIGFKVADKEEKVKTKRDEEKENYKYPIDTYAIGFENYSIPEDEWEEWEDE